jgi:hypothetical protein
MVYSRNPSDEIALKTAIEQKKLVPVVDKPLSPAYYIHRALINFFPEEKFRCELYIPSTADVNLFPVLMNDGGIENSTRASAMVGAIPRNIIDYIFCDPTIAEDVRNWIGVNRALILEGKRPQ